VGVGLSPEAEFLEEKILQTHRQSTPLYYKNEKIGGTKKLTMMVYCE
jgi:hypothetical protein